MNLDCFTKQKENVCRDKFYLAFHRVRIDLTHVRAPVFPTNRLDVQRPRIVIVVGDG